MQETVKAKLQEELRQIDSRVFVLISTTPCLRPEDVVREYQMIGRGTNYDLACFLVYLLHACKERFSPAELDELLRTIMVELDMDDDACFQA